MAEQEKELKELKKELQATKATASEAKTQATEEDHAAVKFHFAGYGTADYTRGSANDAPDSFGGSFNPIFVVGYKDLLLFKSELEFAAASEGDTEFNMEFANLSLFATDWMTVTAGKFLSPIGDFQQHQHPSWINKLPDRPAGFVEDGGAEPLTDVGVMVHGAFPVGSMTADYAVFAGNGPRLSDDPAEGVLLEGFGGDNNDNKAFGGRIGLHPVPYVTIGFSGMHAVVDGNNGSGSGATNAGYDLVDVDAAFVKDYWNIRGEFIRAHLNGLTTAFDDGMPQPITGTTWRTWYVQGSYRLAGLTDNRILGNFEPVVRYSQLSVSGFDEFKANEEKRISAGLDYWFAPSIVAKIAYEHRDFENQEDDDVLRLQFAYGF